MPMTIVTNAGARVKSMKRTSTATDSWKKASMRPREARTASMPSLMSISMRRNRLALSATAGSAVRFTGGISDAKMSVPAMASNAAPTQYGAYRSILDRIGASAPPTTSVSTMVSSDIELAVMSAERGRMVGITAASAGPNSCPTAEKMKVMSSRCTKSVFRPGTNAAMGMSAIAAPRPKLHHIISCLRLTRSASTPAGGARSTAGTV